MHASPDGLALAVVDGSQSVAPAVSVGPASNLTSQDLTSQDLEVCQCVTQARLLVAAGFVMTLLCAGLALGSWGDLGGYDEPVGFAGVAIFGLLTVRFVWQLPTDRGPVVIVTPYGIRDRRIGNEFLLWESILTVSAEECRGRRMIVLTPTPGLQRQLCTIRALAHAGQDDRIVIRGEGLATDFDALLSACCDYHATCNRRTALQQS